VDDGGVAMRQQHGALGDATEALNIGAGAAGLGVEDADDDAAALRTLLGAKALAVKILA
jgi:hypothetical protein